MSLPLRRTACNGGIGALVWPSGLARG